jgi:AcrR family transcriptional regulator
MTRHLPTDNEVREAMAAVLAEAEQSGRHATVSAVERRLDIPHPTFYRNYKDLIERFKEQAGALRTARAARRAAPRTPLEETIARLRRENEDLRRTVNLYAEKIRQLTLDNDGLQAVVNARAGVADLDARRRRTDTGATGPC